MNGILAAIVLLPMFDHNNRLDRLRMSATAHDAALCCAALTDKETMEVGKSFSVRSRIQIQRFQDSLVSYYYFCFKNETKRE